MKDSLRADRIGTEGRIRGGINCGKLKESGRFWLGKRLERLERQSSSPFFSKNKKGNVMNVKCFQCGTEDIFRLKFITKMEIAKII